MKILLKSNAFLSFCSHPIFLMLFLQTVTKLHCIFSSRLLYAVFVVSNENTSVAELATTLQADLSQLQAAASFVCRLGWATKVIDPSSILQDTNIPGSPRSAVSDEDASLAGHGFDNTLIDNDTSHGDSSGNCGPRSAYTRVAFIVDANITSYLMMGSVSPGIYLSLPHFLKLKFICHSFLKYVLNVVVNSVILI